MTFNILSRTLLIIASALAVTGCGGESFDQRATNISACVIGNWDRLGPRLFNRDQLTLSFRDDGTYVERRTGNNSSDGTWHVNILAGPWFQYGDNIVRARVQIADGYGATEAEANADAEQALLSAPVRTQPSTTSGSTHCDNEHFKSDVLIRYSTSPEVFRNERYLGFRETWPARTPTALATEQLTLNASGIAEILRTEEYFDGSAPNTQSITHAAYAYQSSSPDGTPVLALTDCTGRSGCSHPESIPAGIEYEYVDWKTALSTGTRYGVGETTGKADYFAR